MVLEPQIFVLLGKQQPNNDFSVSATQLKVTESSPMTAQRMQQMHLCCSWWIAEPDPAPDAQQQVANGQQANFFWVRTAIWCIFLHKLAHTMHRVVAQILATNGHFCMA